VVRVPVLNRWPRLTLYTEIEDEISKLKEVAEPSTEEKARLASLEKELENIMIKKEAYVAEHPEQRRLVYRKKNEAGGSSSKDTADVPAPLPKARNVFDKNGLPRHPERSVYYDPVMNPYGVAPPGMPYMERREFSFVFLSHCFDACAALLPGEGSDEEAEVDDGKLITTVVHRF
jgi:hypothetical protein